jgi:predicted RNase H-like HicB family nuclease
MDSYIGLIHKDQDSDYVVTFPDLPGVISAGKDLVEAKRMAEEALTFHLEGMEEDHDPIPEPSSLETIMNYKVNHDAIAMMLVAPQRYFAKSVESY